jgi:hypothetical protein
MDINIFSPLFLREEWRWGLFENRVLKGNVNVGLFLAVYLFLGLLQLWGWNPPLESDCGWY